MSDRNSFGIPETGQLLRLARSMAGFSSARAAAIHYGWSEPTMRAHESGTRRISPKDAEKYAAVFRVPVNAFRDAYEARAEIERVRLESGVSARGDGSPEKQGATSVGARLKLARKIRGFASAFDFSVAFGFVLPTLSSHEAGINTVSERMAEAYSEALGVSSAWLLRGELPSQLGYEVDNLMNSAGLGTDLDTERLARVAEPAPSPNYGKVAELINAAKGKPAAGNSTEDEIFEVQPSSIGQNVDSTRRLRSWKLPKGLVQSLFGASVADTVILALEHPVDGLERGDRVFVDTSRRDATTGGEFAYNEADGWVVFRRNLSPREASSSSHLLIGKVVARIVRLQG